MAGQVSDNKIKKYYDNYDYLKVIENLKKEPAMSTVSRRRLAESYKITGDFKKAEEQYAAVNSADGRTAEDLYQYAQLLKMNGNYTEAMHQMEQYVQLKPGDSRAQLYNENKNYYEVFLQDKGRFRIKNMAINSPEQDFGVTYIGSKIIYTSSRHVINAAYRRWNGNNLPFLDLYTASEDSSAEITGAKKLSVLNKKYHEGPASYSKGISTVIYTKDNYASKSADGTRNLELYEAKIVDGKWGERVPLTLNNKEYSVGHPAISEDGSTLYFASDMPGGKGGTDLYKVTRMPGGPWGNPENLGDKINTEGNEVFPFMHGSGLFFFSSDGRPGLGGLDVFISQLKNGELSKATNVGAPVNSSKDDFSFVLHADKTKGFFSSNREGGKGDDDIYSFNVLKPLQPERFFKGLVKDRQGNIMPGMMVYLYDAIGNVIDSAKTDLSGHFIFVNLDAERSYLAEINETFVELRMRSNDLSDARNNFFRMKDLFKNLDADQSFLDVIVDADPQLNPSAKTKAIKQFLKEEAEKTVARLNDELPPVNEPGKPVPGILPENKPPDTNEQSEFSGAYKKLDFEKKKLADAETEDPAFTGFLNNNAGSYVLKNIYFDLDKFNIRQDAATVLDKVTAIMNKYPGLRIEVSAYTDCRASQAYNKILSGKRADATVNYVRSKITNPWRISGKGYGESKLINACECEDSVRSACSEEEHEMNRRTEFSIINTETVTLKK